MPISRTLALLPASLLLAACEASLDVSLTDAPADQARQLLMTVNSVQLLQEDGGIVTLDADELRFDLLDYRDGETLELVSRDGDVQGDYIGIRPVIETSDLDLTLANGGQAGVAVLAQPDFADLDFSLDDGEALSLVLDLDLRFSLVDDDDGSYSLRPVVRAADRGNAALIEGEVDAALVGDDDCREGRSVGTGVAIYAFAGDDRTPNDYYDDGSIVAAQQPMASAPVAYEADSDSYRYRLHFIPPGDYTLALTCQADSERPDADDDLLFLDTLNISAGSGETVEADFDD